MSKLDWMYKSSNTVDPEDYLLGKAIDKNFEAQGSSKNEVDKDILPTSIFANANSSAPVDIFRKIKEDPLEQIKQKEIEMRKQLLKNPVKLKKLQSMLKAKAEKKDHKKKKKKSKSKDIDDRLAQLLQKYGTEKIMELTKSDSEEEDGKSRARSKKCKRSKNRSGSSSSEYSRSRDRDEKKKAKRRRSSSTSSGERGRSRRNDRDDKRDRRRGRKRSASDDGSSDRNRKKSGKESDSSDLMRLIEKHGAKMLMELVSDDSDEGKSKRKKPKKSKAESDSDDDSDRGHKTKKKPSAKSKHRRKSSSGSEDESRTKKGEKSSRESAKGSVAKRDHRSSSSSSYSPDDDDNLKNIKSVGRRRRDSSDDEKTSFKKAYGLVLPKGVEAKPKPARTAPDTSKAKADEPKKFARPKPTKLTEEEKEARLKEMMANGQWRDKERKSNVDRYRKEAKREADSQQYDEGFMRKELAKAVDSSNSVEERIRSRMNNVQRSKFSMSQNFARRN